MRNWYLSQIYMATPPAFAEELKFKELYWYSVNNMLPDTSFVLVLVIHMTSGCVLSESKISCNESKFLYMRSNINVQKQ